MDVWSVVVHGSILSCLCYKGSAHSKQQNIWAQNHNFIEAEIVDEI